MYEVFVFLFWVFVLMAIGFALAALITWRNGQKAWNQAVDPVVSACIPYRSQEAREQNRINYNTQVLLGGIAVICFFAAIGFASLLGW